MCDPDLAEAHYNLGVALAELQRFPEAIAELKEAVSLDPESVDARVQLGLVMSQNDPAGAANIFRALVRRDPKFAEGHNNLGLVLLQSGDLAKAEAEFAEAIRLKPEFAEAHYNLALAFRQQGKESEAQRELAKAYELAPELKSRAVQ